MAEIAKRLSFHEGGLAPAPAGEMAETTAAVEELRRVQMDLSTETRNHGLNRLQEARVSVDNGAGENDLKRLQRKFQATKASYINVDVKERFMQSLRDGSLDVAVLEDTHRGLEEQLQRDSEALRTLKDQNSHAKHSLHETSVQIATLHQQFEQVMSDVATQLDALERNLQQFEATRPPPLEPLEPGPDQDECDALLAEEMARAKQLETAIASSEATIQEAEPEVRSGAQELAALQAEVVRLTALQADREKAADSGAHLSRAAKWAEAAAAAVEALGGVAIKEIAPGRLVLQITCCVPTALAADAPLREERHELALQLRPGGAQLAGAALEPAAVAVDDIAAAAAAPSGGGVRAAVCGVQLRLLQHWSRQALVDAAAARYPLQRVEQPLDGAAAVFEASLPARPGVKLTVALPDGWPRAAGAAATAAAGPALVAASGEGLDAAALAAAVARDGALRGADLAGFLDGVASKVDALMTLAAA
ncbi:hypothetical protein Rsub_04725 [Raphidocelis subcapitata]|uniref:Uncharacterized protein n=1 Tax=Raphidocelis subcapitata TaxID=307507 RepID=A0A2V0NWJ7_9CHLO|nr:hypothetical protein Rsub_04725 [Raphidocelis subcapitata]|eukprot:GBF92001.1 hypothetical protein Rsub_04725 [Raphidocelis subcapitata]